MLDEKAHEKIEDEYHPNISAAKESTTLPIPALYNVKKPNYCNSLL